MRVCKESLRKCCTSFNHPVSTPVCLSALCCAVYILTSFSGFSPSRLKRSTAFLWSSLVQWMEFFSFIQFKMFQDLILRSPILLCRDPVLKVPRQWLLSCFFFRASRFQNGLWRGTAVNGVLFPARVSLCRRRTLLLLHEEFYFYFAIVKLTHVFMRKDDPFSFCFLRYPYSDLGPLSLSLSVRSFDNGGCIANSDTEDELEFHKSH